MMKVCRILDTICPISQAYCDIVVLALTGYSVLRGCCERRLGDDTAGHAAVNLSIAAVFFLPLRISSSKVET